MGEWKNRKMGKKFCQGLLTPLDNTISDSSNFMMGPKALIFPAVIRNPLRCIDDYIDIVQYKVLFHMITALALVMLKQKILGLFHRLWLPP